MTKMNDLSKFISSSPCSVNRAVASDLVLLEAALPAAPFVLVAIPVGSGDLRGLKMYESPDGGQWCGYEQATFAGLVEGNDYQAGITLFFREGRAKLMPLKAYLIERMKLGIVKGKLAAWTVKQLKADNDNVTEETTTGFAGRVDSKGDRA